MNEQELIEHFERENITLASISSRVLAYSIDEVIIAFLFMFIYWEQFQNVTNTEQTILLINSMFFYIVLLRVVYHFFFVWMYGATLGKMLMKIRVLSVKDVSNPSIEQSLTRSCVRVVSETIFYLGFLWGALNPKRETWHDKASRTLVVNA